MTPPSNTVIDPLRPSEYTALLIQAIRMTGPRVTGASVLEIGVGSGVVLAALAALGARRLSGVDIEAEAVTRAGALLSSLGADTRSDLVQGDMWSPYEGQRFDLIVANLPHFPATILDVPGRLSTWSLGGTDGRALLDPFLDGLTAHLAADGRALVTHNGFVDLDQSRSRLQADGLELRAVITALVHIAPDKLCWMTPAIRERYAGSALQQYGGYVFGELHVVEITRRPSPFATERRREGMASDGP